MIPETESAALAKVARADLHCHSTASEESRLGVQRALGLPECATPPEEVYELAKRRGMDFVTITDHDTIAGCAELADRPDFFVSEELTSHFAGEPQAVHVLCLGIDSGDHDWLQAHSGDVEACADYLRAEGIACALAHPFYDVAAPLTPRHRRVLAELFDVWEVRNGSRAPELNMPAEVYTETNGGIGIAGSDDHAGVDIGRTFTEVHGRASTPEEYLANMRQGDATPCGEQGSAAKWAHAAIALATRALALDGRTGGGGAPDPAAMLKIAERVISEGGAREGITSDDLGPEDARGLLEAWLESVDLDLRGRDLIAHLQADGFSHAEFYRQARRKHARRLRAAISDGTELVACGNISTAATAIFAALVPAIPYAPATAFLGREKAKLARRGIERPRVALVADGIEATHGVSRTVGQIRELGVPGFDVEVIGTDSGVDRRLPAVAELEVPLYEGMALGVPAVPDVVETLTEGRYDLVHVTAPGPAGVAAVLVSKMAGLPLLGSYHTEFASYAAIRGGGPALRGVAALALGAFYRAPQRVLSPSAAGDASLRALAVEPDRICRWERGVDSSRFHPRPADRAAFPGAVNVLYAGRLTSEKGAELMADSFRRARETDPRLHLLLAGGGPEEGALRARLGENATFLGWLEDEELARVYASADLFLFCSATDTYGQVISEAGASGLPVVAVAEGGPATLVEEGRTGLLRPADPDRLAEAILELAASPVLRRHLAAGGVRAARTRTWERALEQLAAGYDNALASPSRHRQEGWALAA